MRLLLPILLLILSLPSNADVRVWRTTANTDGNLGGRAGADAFCDGDGNKPVVANSTTRAFISVNGTDEIRDMATLYNIPTNEVIFRQDGTTQIAANFAALLNAGTVNLTNSINGIGGVAGAAFTGSDGDGALNANNCTGWTSNVGNGMSGLGNSTNGGYLETGLTNCSIGNQIGLFCITYTAAATVPDAPTIGTATPGDETASIAFTAPGNDGGSAITGYTASCGAGTNGTGASSPLIVTGLTNGTTYNCSVTATNAIGTSAASATVTVTPAYPFSAPDAPTLTAIEAGNAALTLTFTQPSNNGGKAISGYTASCQLGTSSSSNTAISVSVPNPGKVTVSGLVNDSNYNCSVVAKNDEGTSLASNSLSGTPTAGEDNSIEPTVTLSDENIIQQIQNTDEVVGDNNQIQLSENTDGTVSAVAGNSTFNLKPVNVTKNVSDAVPGITITTDGTIEVVTDNQSKVTFLSEPKDLTNLVNELQDLGFEIKQEAFGLLRITFNGNTNKATGNTWYSSRAAYDIKPADASQTHAGLVSSASNTLPNTIVYDHYFFVDSVLYRQRLYPTPADWSNLKTYLESQFTQVGINLEGVITVVAGNNTYQALTDYEVKATNKSLDNLMIEAVDDINGDGLDDYQITYTNGDTQVLYLLSVTNE